MTGTRKLWESFPELKRSESEFNHSPFSSTKVKSKRSYTSVPPISSVAWTGRVHLLYLYRKSYIYWTSIILIVENQKTNLMSLAIFISLLMRSTCFGH